MSERTSYQPGTPSWVDIGVPDTAQAAAFYGALFGWEAEFDDRPEAGGYGMFTLRGKNVAGVGPQQGPDMPPYWTVYVTVTDLAATVQKATDDGATVLAGPMTIFDAGDMAVLQDSVGSFISLWQANQHIGAEIVNEPGSFGWNELATNDLAGATAFYQSVFGWGFDAADAAPGGIFTLDGEPLCGVHTAGEGEFPAWTVWFTVDDTDASTAQVRDLGGAVFMEPTDMSFGRGSVVADPAGAVFGLASLSEPAV
jgi:predicted enzyme related to lactoylglutathione lyase